MDCCRVAWDQSGRQLLSTLPRKDTCKKVPKYLKISLRLIHSKKVYTNLHIFNSDTDTPKDLLFIERNPETRINNEQQLLP